MTLSLRILSTCEVLTDATAGLSIRGSSESVRLALIAAHLRAACEGEGTRSGHGVFSGRLTDMIERDLGGLLGPAEARPLAKQVLEALEKAGDLWRSPGGYWHSTPPRAVSLPDGLSFLLGVVPHGGFIAAGAFRYAGGRAGGMVVQGFDDWLGRAEPIGIWMAKALKRYRPGLQHAGISADHLEIYAPDQASRQLRSRWINPQEVELSGVSLRLCRAQSKPTSLYDRPYYLGEFEHRGNGLSLRRAVPVEHEHARRFRFAYDEALGASRTLELKQTDDMVQVVLARDLPIEEGRVLALGWELGGASPPSVVPHGFSGPSGTFRSACSRAAWD
ncbi:hypothetical protein [Mesorhizobium sp. M2A.F.Ca.ET.039.01.1.1]|uniref:hypothetical protein n=1 Tax=Mesorhizobium sp. M2A.F.Ca.ET.039.01.1.1 TaxID=2496746 RepID=UPI000FC9B57C|nr:hypothetical protein [Mesorhizobium sp. M2A.F.Ca.ET.039.01.1.1]RWX72286.1 hypothetical protein EOA24_02080 [Mesorhizobium sp. M2A.F.Ca.ET.039.01.1.1]